VLPPSKGKGLSAARSLDRMKGKKLKRVGRSQHTIRCKVKRKVEGRWATAVISGTKGNGVWKLNGGNGKICELREGNTGKVRGTEVGAGRKTLDQHQAWVKFAQRRECIERLGRRQRVEKHLLLLRRGGG